MAASLSEPIKKFLTKPNFAVLVTQSRSGRAQATPVWFMHADGEILINTSAGRVKHRNMQADPKVTLAVVDRENPYQYVQIQGRVVKFDKEHGAADIDRLSQRYLGRPYQYSGNDNPRNRVTIRIQPERVAANF